MPQLYQDKNGIWYKRETENEKEYKSLITGAINHSLGAALPHTLNQIKGNDELKNSLKSIKDDIVNLKQTVSTNANEVKTVIEANKRIKHLETKLFYNAWFFKNGSFDLLDFDSFEDESKLFYGVLSDSKLVPELNKKNDYSIYRTIKFLPKLPKPITRYMMHVDYHIENNGGLIVEISFDEGNNFHTMLSTIADPGVAYYYQYPNFCDCDNTVTELDVNSFIIRFRLLSNANGSGVHVSSYGIAIS